MDIRTKLALALVSISLLSMLVLGTFAYQTASELLGQVSERQLDALAESKQRDLEKVIQGWREHVQLIRSRTRLRALVAENRIADDAKTQTEVRRILEDAVDSVESLERLFLFDTKGRRLLSVGESAAEPRFLASRPDDDRAVHYSGTTIVEENRPLVHFQTNLQHDDRVIGILEAVIDAEDLLTVTQNYTGLGDSGESLVVMRDPVAPTERAIALAPLRHDAGLRSLSLASAPYVTAALTADESVFRTDVQDYRGADIWCATRSLPDVNWGVIVKMDAAEETERTDWLWDQMIDLGLALGAVAIFGGTLLGFRLGRPIRDLNELVKRIRSGERELRADASAPDEVGFLAEALNDLLDEHHS